MLGQWWVLHGSESRVDFWRIRSLWYLFPVFHHLSNAKSYYSVPQYTYLVSLCNQRDPLLQDLSCFSSTGSVFHQHFRSGIHPLSKRYHLLFIVLNSSKDTHFDEKNKVFKRITILQAVVGTYSDSYQFRVMQALV